MKRILIVITGWGFILLGIASLVLPFLQGILFILIGIVVLSSQYGWARWVLTKLRRRFPGIGRMADAARIQARTWLQRLSG